MQVYVCQDNTDSIFTGVYDAWASGFGHENVRIEVADPEGGYEMELFSQYHQVETDFEKAQKVARSVQRKLSPQVFEMIWGASLSFDRRKGDRIYRFLVSGFSKGRGFEANMADPAVADLFELNCKVRNEAHLFTGFLRFTELKQGFLIAKITPKCQVLPILAPHFADRFPDENWMIFDTLHRMAAFHEKGKEWFLTDQTELEWERIKADSEDLKGEEETEDYEALWKLFHRTIAIKERRNPRCQRTMLPLWYRRNMLEFDR